MGLEAAFWILGIIGVAAALIVVTVRNVFRAALALALCFLTVAGIYITLSADFLAAVQVLVYVGAISVLILLGVMLTRRVQKGSETGRLAAPAVFVAVIFAAVLSFAALNTPWEISGTPPLQPTTAALANLLFGEGGYILAIEMSAVLLLAAILGAIILVREK